MQSAFRFRHAVMAALLAAFSISAAADEPTTVCTITVNSADEKTIFQRSLPSDRFRFVELVERGRPDWLASACRKGVRCDVLLISGHFDGGDEFYSDRLDARESLPVAELERVSCSDSCPGLFSQLKEVYLFGCNTLNAEASRSASAEIVRALVRSGHSPADAEQLSRILSERHAETNRDRMRQIFKDVPVIYGFSSKAPLGRNAAPTLERYFQTAGTGEIATGKPSARLLGLFAPASMTVTAGTTDADAQAGYRRDVCHFSDDRLTPAQRLRFVHELLDRDVAEVRMFLDRLEQYADALSEGERHTPAVAAELLAISQDARAREQYVAFVHDADEPAVRVRMIELAARLGWLTPAERHAEIARVIAERLAQGNTGALDIDLVCALNRKREFDGALSLQATRSVTNPTAGQAALLACLGSGEAHAQVLRALASSNDADVESAEIYLRHRPISDPAELRDAAAAIARMHNSDAQVRALDTLAHHRLSDRESLEALTNVFLRAKTASVQRAVAGILIRADYQSIARPELVRALREHRLKSPDGQDMIDALIRRLQQASVPSA
jgi:hypothetical protein